VSIAPYFPYRSEKAKAEYLVFLDRMAKDWPIPQETRMVLTAYGETFVRIGGPAKAEPLVLLPGINTTSLLWAPNIAALSQRYRTYAVDMMGDIGRSVSTRRIRDTGNLMSWLDELFRELKLKDGFHLLGVSYGGWAAAQYGLRFSKRLGKLVLLAPAASVLPTNIQFYLRAIPMLTRTRSAARGMVRWLMEDLARKDPARLELSLDRVMMTMACLRPHRVPGPNLLTDDEWQSFSMPVLFVVGEHEKIYSASKAIERLKNVAPQVRTQIVAAAGHDLTVVQPEIVSRAILEFLA